MPRPLARRRSGRWARKPTAAAARGHSRWRLPTDDVTTASGRSRPINVDDGRPAPRPYDHDVALIVTGIALPMNRTLRHVQKITGTGVHHFTAAGPGLHP